MIERMALDNFRGFDNFEWNPGPVNLISGINGAGKSTLLDAGAAVLGARVVFRRQSPLFIGRFSKLRGLQDPVSGWDLGKVSQRS